MCESVRVVLTCATKPGPSTVAPLSSGPQLQDQENVCIGSTVYPHSLHSSLLTPSTPHSLPPHLLHSSSLPPHSSTPHPSLLTLGHSSFPTPHPSTPHPSLLHSHSPLLTPPLLIPHSSTPHSPLLTPSTPHPLHSSSPLLTLPLLTLTPHSSPLHPSPAAIDPICVCLV